MSRLQHVYLRIEACRLVEVVGVVSKVRHILALQLQRPIRSWSTDQSCCAGLPRT